MKKILKYLLFVLTFCVVFFISFKINIHRLEFAPMKLMETEWDDSVGTVYVDLDYENENGNTYNLYVPANLDKEKEQYLILISTVEVLIPVLKVMEISGADIMRQRDILRQV